MRYTLLQMVQEILSSMDSDEVNSINDTTEALQVARCIRQAYFDMIDDLDLPEHYSMFELEASGDNLKPTLMYMPSTVNSLEWVKYNKIATGDTAPNYEDVYYLPMKQFYDRMYSLDEDETNVASFSVTVGADTIPIIYVNDRAPTYYTTFGDDYTIVFDSYDSAVDTTLTKTKTNCYGRKTVTFDLDDDFEPDLDEPYFARLLNEAKVLAFAELKSMDHAIANRNAKRSRNRAQAKKFRINRESDFDQLPYFGRR